LVVSILKKKHILLGLSGRKVLKGKMSWQKLNITWSIHLLHLYTQQEVYCYHPAVKSFQIEICNSTDSQTVKPDLNLVINHYCKFRRH